MDTSYVILDDGKRLNFSELLDMVPCTILATPEFVSICEAASNFRGFDNENHRKIYVNLLIKHSKFIAQITALHFLQSNKVLNVSKVFSDKLLTPFSHFLNNIELSSLEKPSLEYIDKRHKFTFLLKSIAHRLYRLFSSSTIPNKDTTIRSWVEISESMFEDSYPNSNILIYPFSLNFSRHIRYIKSVKRRYSSVFFMGLPYKILPAIKNFFSPTDNFYVDHEFRAYSMHAHEIIRFTNKFLKTSDEFEAASFVMCEILKNDDIRVENKAHGISFACPYTSYSDFLVYNLAQKSYYERSSNRTLFNVVERRNAPRTDSIDASLSFSPALVVIHNPYLRVGLSFENNLQDKIFNLLSEYSRDYGIPLYIKKHPNSIASDISYLDQWQEAVKIYSLSELRHSNPIFINISSVSYYDFKQYGPFIFVDDGIVPIKVMFGPDVISVSLSQLSDVLGKYLVADAWTELKQ
ncbi:MAG: hypothetical protein J0M22_04695 [Gammaproteobacteria bacterium]|nr:hypothetical protein [Gammaproteobacteria bacterium]